MGGKFLLSWQWRDSAEIVYSVESFLLEKGREIAENLEGNFKTDKMFHKHDLRRKVTGTAFV